jgi:hypothetical protein
MKLAQPQTTALEPQIMMSLKCLAAGIAGSGPQIDCHQSLSSKLLGHLSMVRQKGNFQRMTLAGPSVHQKEKAQLKVLLLLLFQSHQMWKKAAAGQKWR